MIAKVLMLVIFFGVMIGIGLYCRKNATDVNGFVLGGRNVGPWLTAFAYGTSYFSAVVFIGYAGQFGWKYGIASTWIGLGNAVIGSLMAWVVLGRRTRVMSQHLNSATMPEFFERRYLSKSLKIVAAIIVFIFLIPYTASVYNGLSRLFEMVFSVDYSVCVIAMAVVTAVYVILGGYKATAYNDFIQGIIMLIGIAAVVIATLGQKGGFYSALMQMSQIENTSGEMAGMQGAYTSFFGPDPINLLGVVILTSLGTWGLPQMVTKFYTIKNEKSIKSGMIVSTIFALVVAGGCYFLGGFGRLFVQANESGQPVSGFDSIIPAMLEGLPDLLTGIVVVLVLSASMSTLSSLVLTSSSSITLDLIKPLMKGKLTEKKQLIVLRVFVAVFLIISVVIALNKNALISDLMGYSWGALAGAFLAPFLYGLFWKKTTRASVWASFIFGIGLVILHYILATMGLLKGTFLGFTLASPVNLGAFTMIGSLILVPIVSLLTPKMKKADVDKIFSCYDKKVVVQQREAITAGEDVMEAVPAAATASGAAVAVKSAAVPKQGGSNKKKKKKK